MARQALVLTKNARHSSKRLLAGGPIWTSAAIGFPKWVRWPVSLEKGGVEPVYLHARILEMAKVSPVQFFKEVRSEVQKVTWPSRRETVITTAMVFVMVAIASIFFLVADQIIRVFITFVLGLGS